MSIKREELENVDYSDVADIGAEPIPPTSPGDILLHEFLEPLNMSANALAMDLHVPANRITAIIKRQRSITGDTALRLARYFSTSPEFWMGLQASYDLKQAQVTKGQRITKQVSPRAA